jgi:hypothetical protein
MLLGSAMLTRSNAPHKERLADASEQAPAHRPAAPAMPTPLLPTCFCPCCHYGECRQGVACGSKFPGSNKKFESYQMPTVAEPESAGEHSCLRQLACSASGRNGRGGRSRLCAPACCRRLAPARPRPRPGARTLPFRWRFRQARGNSGGLVPASYARARRGRARLVSQQRALARDPRALALRKRPALRVRPSAGSRTRSDY